MPSDKQLAANRRNARRSTGPRSSAGKRRVSHNAYRHGLTISVAANPAFDERIEQRAREIAGATANDTKLTYARAVAAAEFDLLRVRQVKVALINRIRAFGALERRGISIRKIIYAVAEMAKGKANSLPEPPPVPAMPSEEPDRTAEAIKRAIPELAKFGRYEEQARRRRDRAILQMQRVDLESSFNY